LGIVSGVTTNPTFLKAQTFISSLSYLKNIVTVLEQLAHPIPFNVQVMTNNPAQMIQQAELLATELSYKELVIKIPCGWEQLGVINALAKNGTVINCTACITVGQVVLAAEAGARYVSLFLGKAQDAGADAETLIQHCVRGLYYAKCETELVVGSLRSSADVEAAILAGAHIVTVRTKILKQLSKHSKTEEAITAFSNDYVPLK